MDLIQRFDPESENFALVKQLLKDQGKDVDWITSSLSFGFVYATGKANKYHVQGFVTCRSLKGNSRIIWIDLVCNPIRSKVGKLLMETAENACKEIPDLIAIQFYSPPDTKLRNWYKKLGYYEGPVPPYQGGKPSAYLMTKCI